MVKRFTYEEIGNLILAGRTGRPGWRHFHGRMRFLDGAGKAQASHEAPVKISSDPLID
jgi:hypothetical protein